MSKNTSPQYLLKKVENPFEEISNLIGLWEKLRIYKDLPGDEKHSENDWLLISIFQRMMQITGAAAFNNWIRAYSEDVTNFNELWFVLTKSLRQVDFFQYNTTLTVKPDSDPMFSKSMEVKKTDIFRRKIKMLQLDININGHLDMILRNAMRCDAIYNICRDVLAEKLN